MTFGVEVYDSNHPKIEDGIQQFSVITDAPPDGEVLAVALLNITGEEWLVEPCGPDSYYCVSKSGVYKIPVIEIRWAR
jgi:hypothetical protein